MSINLYTLRMILEITNLELIVLQIQINYAVMAFTISYSLLLTRFTVFIQENRNEVIFIGIQPDMHN